MFGDRKQVWVRSGSGSQDVRWVSLFLRSVSQVWRGNELLVPRLGLPEEKTMVSSMGRTGKPQTLPVLSSIPSRADIRSWLLDPPEPPFTIAIAESGKKHILYLAQEACDREFFPVQFELDTLHVDRSYFTKLLNAYEALMAMAFSKTEINSGIYRNDRLITNLRDYQPHEGIIAAERTNGKPSRFLQMIAFIGKSGSVRGATQAPTL